MERLKVSPTVLNTMKVYKQNNGNNSQRIITQSTDFCGKKVNKNRKKLN